MATIIDIAITALLFLILVYKASKASDKGNVCDTIFYCSALITCAILWSGR